MEQQLEELTARVMQRLHEEAKERGVQSPRGIVVQMDPAQHDIATHFGLTRAEATRVLNALKRQGTIAIEGSSIILRA